MELFFCPRCRYPSTAEDVCPRCNLPRNTGAVTYAEKLMETVISADPSRVGMAIDVLTKWLHEPRTIVPLLFLLQGDVDAYRMVMAARGLGWLGDSTAIPALVDLLHDKTRPFVARVAAAQALGQLGGEPAEANLRQATTDERPSVAEAAAQALEEIAGSRGGKPGDESKT